jgi:mono/diheme cytochrome c family protein
MNRGTCRLWTALIVSVGWPVATSAADAQRDLGSAVLAVFSAKCAGCHGPNLAKPKGRFGYVLDLARVAGNPELVIPSSPQESELWEHVHRDEMPPADAPSGPLSPEQKEVIRAWIAAGAPKAASANASEIPTPEAEVSCLVTVRGFARRGGRSLGRSCRARRKLPQRWVTGRKDHGCSRREHQ